MALCCVKWRSWCWTGSRSNSGLEQGPYLKRYMRGTPSTGSNLSWGVNCDSWQGSWGQVGPPKHQSHLSFYFLRFGSFDNFDLSWNYTATQQRIRDLIPASTVAVTPHFARKYIFWKLQIRLKGLNHSRLQIAWYRSPDINAQNGCFPLLHILNQWYDMIWLWLRNRMSSLSLQFAYNAILHRDDSALHFQAWINAPFRKHTQTYTNKQT